MVDSSLTGRTVLVFGAAGALGRGPGGSVQRGRRVRSPGWTGRTGRQPAAGGVRYAAADVLDDAALGALLDAAPAPWAVVNTVGGFARTGRWPTWTRPSWRARSS